MNNSKDKKRILILCEYFPPFGNTAAYRPYAWYKFLPEQGFYPVVFCKNYVNAAKHHIQQDEQGEIHYIQVADDPLKVKIERTKQPFLKGLYIVLSILLENSPWHAPQKALKKAAEEYLEKQQADILIATGSPFVLFNYTSILSKKFGIKWIADYRDDWSTNEVFVPNQFVKLLKKLDYFREIFFTKSATFFITVSDHYKQKLERLLNKKGVVIENGYLPDDIEVKVASLPSKKLSILYSGLLYPSQRIDMLLKAIDILNEKYGEDYEILFLGGDPRYFERLHGEISTIKFLPRVSRHEALEYNRNADLLLFLPFHGKQGILKGVPASKLYDYIYSRKPILVCGSDDDIVLDKLTKTKQGNFCESPDMLAEVIIKYIVLKKTQPVIPLVEIPEKIMIENSRAYQTKLLGELLQNL